MQFPTKRKSGRTWIVTPDGSESAFEEVKVDNTILKALIKAHLWQRELDKGKYESVKDLARSKNINDVYVRKILNLNYLPPKVKIAILDGTQPKEMKLQDLMENGVELTWKDKRELL
jgi:hypothetical protein